MTVEEKNQSLAKGLGRNLKFLRESEGMTQEQLAVAFDVNQNTISSWEVGRREPGLYHLCQMKQFFGVDLYRLIYGQLEPPLVIRNLVYLQEKYGVSNQEIGLIMGLAGMELKRFCKSGFIHFEYSRENINRAADYFGFQSRELILKDLSQEARKDGKVK